MGDRSAEDLWRALAPQVLGALVRRYGRFDTCEDAVQEALLAAAVQWPEQGIPREPRTWLIRVASRKMVDLLRSDQARRDRETAAAAQVPREQFLTDAADAAPGAAQDDSLTLLFLCCHPALSTGSQLALTLRAVGGLTTGEIAHALLVPDATMAQRISRAKQRIKASSVPFGLPAPAERAARLATVLHVLYLIFNEGYTGTAGEHLQRVELAAEAIRLARLLHRLLPDDGEVAGLLALMLLTDARRPARTGPAGELIPLAEQDRRRWDQNAVAEGVALLTDAMSRTELGPLQLQAAIAAVHDEAACPEDTDWTQILGLYQLLETMTDNPVITLNRAVATAMVRSPASGLAVLDTLNTDERVTRQHRYAAVRAHLLEMAGNADEAQLHYRIAAQHTTSIPEQRYLLARAARLRTGDRTPVPLGQRQLSIRDQADRT